MNEKSISEAKDALDLMLKSQPNLLAPKALNENSGKEIANFMAAFIRQYSGHLDAIRKDQSPK